MAVETLSPKMAGGASPKRRKIETNPWGEYKVILGSSSRFRKQYFEKFFPDVELHQMSPDIDEKAIRFENAERLVGAIASAKADALVPKISKDEPALLICLDQVVRVNGEICEKPENKEEALKRLEEYNKGTPGECVNGITVMNTKTGQRLTEIQNGKVWLENMDEDARNRIIERGIIFECAGGISVDEDPDCKIAKTDCDLDVIVGLPVKRLKRMLNYLAAETKSSPPPGLDSIPKCTTCLFDMDGLVLDTESIYTGVQDQIAAAVGKTFTWDLKAKIMGMKGIEACGIIVKELGLNETGEELYKRRSGMLVEEFPKAELMPGAEEVIRHLKGNGVNIALATSSDRKNFNLKTTLHKDLFKLFDHIFTGDMVSKGKPNPEIFLKAAGAFDPPIESDKCVVFEDAPNGVESGLNAKMYVVHIPDERLEAKDRGKATIELKSLDGFDPAQFGLPPRSMP